MNYWDVATIILATANLLLVGGLVDKMGGFGRNSTLEFMSTKIRILFGKKIYVHPHIQHYSPKMKTGGFVLVKEYKCSDGKYYKLASGSYTIIVPEDEIHSMGGKRIQDN